MKSKYVVGIEGSDLVAASIADGPTALNTARAIAGAICRINPDAVVTVTRPGGVERYQAKAVRAYRIERLTPLPNRHG